MRTLLAPTEDEIKIERTTLAADATAGSNVTLTFESNDQMAENGFIVIGREGTEKAELEKINQAVSGASQARVATLLRDHKAGEPVTIYRYDKRKFYGSLTENGTYVELTDDGSPKAIQVDDPQGTLLEYTGDEGYLYFKATYYNSHTLEETSEDDSEAVEADESKRYASIHAIRSMAGFTENRFITDGRIEHKRQQAEDEINSNIITVYSLPLDSVPPILKYVCELLAAGYLHYEEFGNDGEGVKKLGEARGILNKIKKGEMKLILDGTELETGGTSNDARLSANPSSTSDRKFTKDMVF